MRVDDAPSACWYLLNLLILLGRCYRPLVRSGSTAEVSKKKGKVGTVVKKYRKSMPPMPKDITIPTQSPRQERVSTSSNTLKKILSRMIRVPKKTVKEVPAGSALLARERGWHWP